MKKKPGEEITENPADENKGESNMEGYKRGKAGT
jgi:hypothetical protein